MPIPHIKDIDVRGKCVVVRADFNVSLAADNAIINDNRIREAIPTIEYLQKNKAITVILSHLGRPKGRPEASLSLLCVSKRLSQLLKHKVRFMKDYISKEAPKKIRAYPEGSVVLCENIRFYPNEEQNDPVFAKQLSRLGDIFVNDAFGAAHRAHASTVGITAHIPSYAGFLLAKEITLIGEAIEHPKRPLVVIIGGGKTPEKIRVIEKLLDIADTIYLGGAIANTFFATWGIGVGVSRVDHEMIEMARNVLWKATRVHSRLLLPCDVMVSNIERTTSPMILPYNTVPLGLGIYDIGPKAQKELHDIIRKAKTVIWNGPMGLYEDAKFASGTRMLCESIAESQAISIIGGGDTIATITDNSVLKKIDLISTGGAAMLEFIEKGTLPTIEALKNGYQSS
jgi:phosphoglycerate kinase